MARLENGLPADDWLLLADVESPFTEHVLESLATQGIAAFAEPSTSPEATYLGSGRSVGPSDRVMVDRRFRAQARAVLAGLLPELRAELAETLRQAEDNTWQQIVRDLNEEGVGARVMHDDVAEAEPTAPDPDQQWDDLRPAAVDAAANDDEHDDDPHDHFIPPEPPPLPTTDTITRLAWIALVSGPLFLLLSTLLSWPADSFTTFLALTASVAGFVTLIARMKDRPSHDESGDDGAVV